MKDLANNIAFEINEAVRAGNGYERRFYITVDTVSDFNISVGKYYISLEWGNGKIAYANIITENITGILKKGLNRINNTNGVIYAN